MTEVSASGSVWKRPLLGGGLSSAIAGLTVAALYLMPNAVSGFLAITFLAPAFIVESIIVFATRSPSFRIDDPLGIFISMLFWLVAGAGIAHYFKRNKVAIGCWFLLYLLFIPIGFGIFFLRHYLVN